MAAGIAGRNHAGSTAERVDEGIFEARLRAGDLNGFEVFAKPRFQPIITVSRRFGCYEPQRIAL